MRKLKWIRDCWDYHSQRVSELDVAVDWGDWETEHARCWCCGHTAKLQKCHIIPRSLGGIDEPSNLVPLCAPCHDESPDVADKNEMFKWISSQQNPLSGLGLGRYWHLSSIIEKRAKQLNSVPALDDFKKYLEEAMESTSFHFSQSNTGIKMKESTREWMVNKAFDLYQEQFL